ncbi:TetR/AcrR family transcriptional regulator [Streptomyces sp. NPDC088350]|uniref:TetR/AcrR family transcriptional regulator n=1 Tax=Streptomyces sp. NPDC088350 TaxID=3365854 RepID=UPI003809D1BE
MLTAAAEVFVISGVDTPIRRIAARAGVGTATIYRYFPTRADLVTAVHHHRIEECAEAGPSPPAGADSPFEALRQWADLFDPRYSPRRLIGLLLEGLRSVSEPRS